MNGWRSTQRANFTSISKLATHLQLPIAALSTPFPLNIPKRLVDKMSKGNLNDPLLKQFLPTKQEDVITAGFCKNPVGDHEAIQCGRLLHKYKGRVLLTATSACAMHCRYCFRRHFPYEKNNSLVQELSYIANDPSIHEVILSGGDPLSLSDRALGALIQSLEEIPHLKLLRFHTRFPIGIPERITEDLVKMMHGRLQRIVVIHSNHPLELDKDVINALQKLGVPILNQSVLLKGVNDSVEILRELCLKLVCAGMIPYYIHQLDKVAGAAHFEVDPEKGLAIMEELQESLPGYAVPKYVQELAGKGCKTRVTSEPQSVTREDRVLFPILSQ
jgi:EF-P beta-lysylation protein EpmB